jgi:hypothetical protein
MCITGGVIFFIIRSYINAETKKYQFNYRKYTNSCYHQRQLITQSLRKPSYVLWQLPLILAYSITTHKSQSMMELCMNHKKQNHLLGLPYVAISRATDLDKVVLLSAIRPDHFINKTFTAENIEITEFYHKLKTKFNTYEEI